jgi:hypothetical protein
MEELSWFVGARISRDRYGNVHWFVESSDGLSHGHLVDEGTPTTLIAAVLSVRRAVFAELLTMEHHTPQELPFPDAPPHVRG